MINNKTHLLYLVPSPTYGNERTQEYFVPFEKRNKANNWNFQCNTDLCIHMLTLLRSLALIYFEEMLPFPNPISVDPGMTDSHPVSQCSEEYKAV